MSIDVELMEELLEEFKAEKKAKRQISEEEKAYREDSAREGFKNLTLEKVKSNVSWKYRASSISREDREDIANEAYSLALKRKKWHKDYISEAANNLHVFLKSEEYNADKHKLNYSNNGEIKDKRLFEILTSVNPPLKTALELIAEGYSHTEAAALVGKSGAWLSQQIANIRRRYGCSKTMHASQMPLFAEVAA